MAGTDDRTDADWLRVVLGFEAANGEHREERLERAALTAADGVVVGRAPPATVVIPKATISRQHCRFSADRSGGLFVVDLGSRNGTFVDGMRLEPGEPKRVAAQTALELCDLRLQLGFEYPAAPADDAAPAEAGDDGAGTWQIRTRSAGGRAESHPVARSALESADGIIVGRQKASTDIALADPSVSRRHCRIRLDPAGVLIIADLGSRNGTVVAGRRLPPDEETAIRIGDSIELGAARLAVLGAVEAGVEAVADGGTVFEPGEAERRRADRAEAGGPAARAEPGARGSTTPPLSSATVFDAGAAPRPAAPSTAAPEAPAGGPPPTTQVELGRPPVGLPPTTQLELDRPSGEAAPIPPPAAPAVAEPAPARSRADRSPSPALAAIGGVLIPAAIIVSPLVIVAGSPRVSALAAHYLVGLVLLAVIAYAATALVWEVRRRRGVQAFQELEIERLKSEIALATARAAREEDRTAAAWSGFRKYRVARKVPDVGNICSFYLVAHDGKPNPPFEPGQHVTFQLRVPGQEKPVVRCYTLSSSPHDAKHYRVSIKRVPPPRDRPDLPPGVSSCFFHDGVREGDILDVKAPSGAFFLDVTGHAPVVLIGGGIGITPVLSMVDALAASGSARETWLFYGVRNADEHFMKDHLAALTRDHPNVRLQVCYSDPREGTDRKGVDYDHGERVSVDLFRRLLPSNNYEFYICGPPPMMQSIVADLEAWGVPDTAIHFEAFGPATVKRARKAGEAEAAAAAVAAKITFSKSGKSIDWDPSFGSILELAEANGIVLDSGCRAGSCGTCLSALKGGRVKYLSPPGIEPDAGSCLTCISVPDGDLVLEA